MLCFGKIQARKLNPDASYLEVEKQFYKNKGKIVQVQEVPFDVSDDDKPYSTSSDGLKLARPVPKKGTKFEPNMKPRLSNDPSPSAKRAIDRSKTGTGASTSIPNVILRKPTVVKEDDVEDLPSRLRMKPNLSLKMSNGQRKEQFSDMTLLRRPEPASVDTDGYDDNKVSKGNQLEWQDNEFADFTLLRKPTSAEIEPEGQEQLAELQGK